MVELKNLIILQEFPHIGPHSKNRVQSTNKLLQCHRIKSMHLFLQVRNEATKMGLPPTRESVWSYFIKKCTNNLHIVLCMSPVGETLKTRCRNFPGLVNNVSIDWFTAWPKQALHAVASQFLAEVSLRLEERSKLGGWSIVYHQFKLIS